MLRVLSGTISTAFLSTAIALLLGGCSNDPADHAVLTASIVHQNTISKAPIPISELGLPHRTAKRLFKVSDQNTILEGISIDRDGGLVFADVKGQRVMHFGVNGALETLTRFSEGSPGGTAIHKDGRIYVAVISDQYTRGWIIAMAPDGSSQSVIVGAEKGFIPNDLVFDPQGGFYFTDFKGNSTDPAGGVYHVSPDGQRITPVLQNLSLANGIALSPDGHTLWVTEYGRNLLYKIRLGSPTTPAPLGTSIPYRFTGPGPDSMRTDRAGNVYVAMMRQGRVMVFAPNGVPIRDVLLPDRDRGRNLASASLALSPTSDDLYIVASDGEEAAGASIFRSQSVTNGSALFSHQ